MVAAAAAEVAAAEVAAAEVAAAAAAAAAAEVMEEETAARIAVGHTIHTFHNIVRMMIHNRASTIQGS